MNNIENPHDHDVLCGRGGHSYKHLGNILFHDLISQNKLEYSMSRKGFKKVISHRIVRTIRNLKPPGRFLEFDPETLFWNDIGKKRAIEKTCQALRENQPKSRRRIENLISSFSSQTSTRRSNSSRRSSTDTSTIVTSASSMNALLESARDAIATRSSEVDRTAVPSIIEIQHGSVYFTSSSPYSVPEQISSRSLCSTSDTSAVTSASSTSRFLSSALNSLEFLRLNQDLNIPESINILNQYDVVNQPQHEKLIGMHLNLPPIQCIRSSSVDKNTVNQNNVPDNENSYSIDEEIIELIVETFANQATNALMKTDVTNNSRGETFAETESKPVHSRNVVSKNDAELGISDDCNFESEIDDLIYQTFLDTESKSFESRVTNLSSSSNGTWNEYCKDIKFGAGMRHQNNIRNSFLQNDALCPMRKVFSNPAA